MYLDYRQTDRPHTNRWTNKRKNLVIDTFCLPEVGLQWIQILCGVTFMQISCEPLVRSTRGLQRWVQNWKIDNFTAFLSLTDPTVFQGKHCFREIYLEISSQNKCLHCSWVVRWYYLSMNSQWSGTFDIGDKREQLICQWMDVSLFITTKGRSATIIGWWWSV